MGPYLGLWNVTCNWIIIQQCYADIYNKNFNSDRLIYSSYSCSIFISDLHLLWWRGYIESIAKNILKTMVARENWESRSQVDLRCSGKGL